ncbi:MAG: GatB/YqeY domain-containing protein [Actinomycetota bacterium]
MTIAEQIKTDVGTAMKAGEKDRVGALRLVLSELQKAEKDGGADEQAILRRERKRRRDAEEQFRAAGRDELASQEAYEAQVIESYLPAELSDDELDALVRDAIAATGASSPRDMGKAIGHVKAAAGGRADGARIAAKVKEHLA